MSGGLSTAERGVGVVFGVERGRPARLPRAPRTSTARTALEAVVLEGLRRPPCGVSFSGGRDSSAVLAVATHVARRHGLADPIPISLRFPAVQTSWESTWQESVVRHLALPHWERVDLGDELDLVGPVARDVLRRHGVQWPFNAYFHVPMLELVRGGSMLTGVGGDEILSSDWAWSHENQVVAGAVRARPLDPVRIAVSVGPPTLRRAFLRLRDRAQGPSAPPAWLTPRGWYEVERAIEQTRSRETLSFARSVRRSYVPRRGRRIGAESLRLLSAERDVHLLSPLAEDHFLAAVCAERGWRMFASRTSATRWLAGDLLPDALIERPSKAWFDAAFFGRHSREFVRTWDGSGLDETFVRPDVLRRLWTEDGDDAPDARTYALLQTAWLASSGS